MCVLRDSYKTLALLAYALLCACSAQQQQQTQQTAQSAALATTVHAKLATVDADAATAVNVNVTGDGIVTLTGEAHSTQERRAYDSAAASVPGVKRVVDRLRVNQQLRGLRETLADAALATKVTANIAGQAGVNAARVKPQVRDGIVTLSGTVTSDSVKTTILETVRKTSGVKSVIDRIEVKS